jgi:lipopolysaccharide export LptBFGC system permease protein LptF
MGASRRQAAWVIAATVVITAGTLIYIFATVPPRSQAISDAVRDAAGATVTATVTVTETFVPPPALSWRSRHRWRHLPPFQRL